MNSCMSVKLHWNSSFLVINIEVELLFISVRNRDRFIWRHIQKITHTEWFLEVGALDFRLSSNRYCSMSIHSNFTRPLTSKRSRDKYKSSSKRSTHHQRFVRVDESQEIISNNYISDKKIRLEPTIQISTSLSLTQTSKRRVTSFISRFMSRVLRHALDCHRWISRLLHYLNRSETRPRNGTRIFSSKVMKLGIST